MLGRQLRLLVEIDHFQNVVAVEVLFAQAGHVAHRADGFFGVTGHEQLKHVVAAAFTPVVGVTTHDTPCQIAASSISRPIRTRSVLDRSPMMRLIGSGSFRMRVGMATIWSRCARLGFCMRSTMSML